MKISLFTRQCEDVGEVAQLRAAAGAAIEHGAAMLVLPGWSLGKGKTSGRALRTLASRTGLSILAETDHTYCFVPDGEPIGPFAQLFATSAKATRAAVDELTEGYLRGERSLQIEHTCIRVLLCGENNVLRNVRAKQYAAVPRYADLGWDLKYDVLVNPAHTQMGQWNLLHRRFAYLSQGGRTLLYCTNRSSASWPTALCVYRDGQLITMGDLEGAEGLATCVRDAWRLVTVDTA